MAKTSYGGIPIAPKNLLMAGLAIAIIGPILGIADAILAVSTGLIGGIIGLTNVSKTERMTLVIGLLGMTGVGIGVLSVVPIFNEILLSVVNAFLALAGTATVVVAAQMIYDVIKD